MATEKKDQANKACFIITPVGPKRSEIRMDTDRLIESVLRPVLEELSYEMVLPHEITDTGTISAQIIQHLISDAAAVANLTGLNPNVMYELAIRHSAALPVVMMADSKVTPVLPFDIAPQRVIFYENALGEEAKLKDNLTKAILSTQKPHKPDNPVYNAVGRKVVLEAPETTNAQKAILESLARLEAKITSAAGEGQQGQPLRWAWAALGGALWEGKVVQGELRPHVYYVRKGIRHYVAHWNFVAPFGLSSATMLRVRQAEIDALPEGHAINSVSDFEKFCQG